MGQSEGDKNWERVLRATGVAIQRLMRHTEAGAAAGPSLTEVRFKLEADEGTSVLAVLKARGQKGDLVGFVGGTDLASTILSIAKKLQHDKVRWRVDRPWGES